MIASAWARRVRVPPLVVDAAHVAALSGFAIAQPLFNLLAGTAQFFGVRGSTSTEIVVFALAVVLLPFFVALLLEGAVGLASETLRKTLHLFFVGGLVALISLRALKQAFDPPAATMGLAALALGIAGALFYSRVRAGRSIVTVLIPAPLIFLAVFLFFSPVEKLVFPPQADAKLAVEHARNDVIFLILDEFPTSSLMNAQEQIDAARYPNFGDLARHSTWFRNATGEHEGTHAAVPAILDSRLPRRGRQPTFADHPQSIFTLLGGRYRMNVWETQTHLCPTSLCRGKGELSTSSVARMHSLFEDAGIVYLHMVAAVVPGTARPGRGDGLGPLPAGCRPRRELREGPLRQVPGLDPAPRAPPGAESRAHPPPARNLEPAAVVPSGHHSELLAGPDGPRQRLGPEPVARRAGLSARAAPARLHGPPAREVPAPAALARDLDDRSVIVVTADQGVSVQAGQSRRSVDPAHPTNLADLAFVPLFFKRPGQQQGRVVDTHVRTMDIGATVADVLGIKIPWRVDGRSFFRRGHSSEVNFLTGRGWAHADVHALARQRASTVRRKVTLFGGGLLRLGPHPELLGRQVSALNVAPAAGRASIDGQVAALLRSLPADSEIQPAQMMGSIKGPGAAENRQLAVAVNGRIAAVTYTYREGSTVRYSAMAPESAFHPGRNEVGLYWIGETRGTPVLGSLGP